MKKVDKLSFKKRTIFYEKRTSAPMAEFPFAILQKGRIIAWACDEAACERFAWSQALTETTQGDVIRPLLGFLQYAFFWSDDIKKQERKREGKRS